MTDVTPDDVITDLLLEDAFKDSTKTEADMREEEWAEHVKSNPEEFERWREQVSAHMQKAEEKRNAPPPKNFKIDISFE